MPKNILNDIVPRNERTVRRIPIPNRHKDTSVVHDSTKPVHVESKKDINLSRSGSARSTKGKKIALFFVCILMGIAIVGVIASTLFSSVTITIHPKQYSFQVDTKILARANPLGNDLSSQVLTSEAEKSIVISAYGEKQVETRATGIITIFNNDTSAQRLIINTRFQTPTGLIYRLVESVNVPARVTREGKTTPGSVDAKVQADDVGEKYNISFSDFTVPGFKGTDKYTKFFARSKTSMTGGFKGLKKIIDEQEATVKKNQLKEELAKEVRTMLEAKVPAEMLFFPSLTKISFVEMPDTSNSDLSLSFHLKAIAHAPAFTKEDFNKRLSESLPKEDGIESYILVKNTDLSFILLEDETSDESFTFTLQGSAIFAADVPSEVIPDLLAGKPKKGFNQALSTLKGVEKAEAKILPSWRLTFPKDPKKIEITLVLD